MNINIFNSLSFSYLLLFKIFFLLILILFSGYLFYMEILLAEHKSLKNNDAKQSASRLNKTIKDILVAYAPAMIAYYSLFSELNYKSLEERKKAAEISKENAEKEIAASKELNVNYELEHKVKLLNILEEENKLSQNFNKTSQNNEILLKIAELKINKLKGENLSAEELRLINSEKTYNFYKKILFEEYNTQKSKVENFLLEEVDTDKKSILNFDLPNIKEILKSFTHLELLAFSGLMLNYIILSYTITIIITLYSDYLINRFDLENKYPKIAKFIQIRKKLQGYYLKISFTWIFLCVLPQIFMYSFILWPKIIELFY